MPIRFRRSINFGFFRLNLSKGGISTSIGKPGASMTIGKQGIRSNLGIPRTGVSLFSIAKPPKSPESDGESPQEPLQSNPPPVFSPPPPQTPSNLPSENARGRPQGEGLWQSQSPKRKTWILAGGGVGVILILATIFGKPSTPNPVSATVDIVATMVFQTLNAPTATFPPTITATLPPAMTETAMPTFAPTITEAPRATLEPTIEPASVPAPLHPYGTTGRCRDGSYTEAKHSQGACSHHDGLAEYWGP